MSQASGSDFNVATLRAISLFEGLATPQFEALAASMLMRRLEPETLIRFSSRPLGRTILSTIKRGHLTILKSPQEFLQ